MALSYTLTRAKTPTDEAKNVPDGGDKDNQGVGAGQQDHGDDGVADPAELLGGAQELVDGGANLHGERQNERLSHMTHFTLVAVTIYGRLHLFDTYGEKHHGDGEGDGGQHSQTDDQQDHIRLIDLGVGVQQLRLHVHCVERQQRPFRPEAHTARFSNTCAVELPKCVKTPILHLSFSVYFTLTHRFK